MPAGQLAKSMVQPSTNDVGDSSLKKSFLNYFNSGDGGNANEEKHSEDAGPKVMNRGPSVLSQEKSNPSIN
jgi:hypothetical protein|tara:strand:+ start:49 stop:261 length:213 start_codon:yes stop_codon:yes gene_type:complete